MRVYVGKNTLSIFQMDTLVRTSSVGNMYEGCDITEMRSVNNKMNNGIEGRLELSQCCQKGEFYKKVKS